MLRLLHLVVIGCLVAAAVALYQVKYESTAHVQKIAKLRSEIRIERERTAWLRAEWNRLSSPERVQDLAQRHLGMKSVALARMEEIAALPEKPDPTADPIGDLIAAFDPATAAERTATGTLSGRN
jgi:cell division protein FtsL